MDLFVFAPDNTSLLFLDAILHSWKPTAHATQGELASALILIPKIVLTKIN
jgi:hypothetical protein